MADNCHKNQELHKNNANSFIDTLIISSPPLFILKSSCPIHHTIINVIRMMAALYMTSLYCSNAFIAPDSVLNNFLYLTRNGYFYGWLYFTLRTQFWLMGYNQSNKLKYFIEIIYQVAISLEVTITAMYWIVLYQGNEHGYDMFSDISYHAVPALFLFTDLIINPYRFLPKNFKFVLIAGSFYMLTINLPYSLLVKPIYNVIDWVSLSSYFFTLLALVASGLTYALCNLLYSKVKKNIFEKANQSKNPLLESEEVLE